MTAERDVDVLVIGDGVAGASVALGLAGLRSVLVVSAGDGSTRWAQGGVAAAVSDADTPAAHAEDTAAAGADLCDPTALAVLTEGGPAALARLLHLGARFDRSLDGSLALGLEGGHRARRIAHAGGDATGAEVHRVLTAGLTARGVERWAGEVESLLTGPAPGGGGAVCGAVVRMGARQVAVRARAVVLATGGIGHCYARTTNPEGVRGAGLALALRAGATLTDVEFVQFHPTALVAGATRGRLPLVSEALRGEGAVLRDDGGRRFLPGRHPLADLAPRDVVARAAHEVMGTTGAPHVWLDARAVPDVVRRFPTFAAACARHGLDPVTDLVPVAPAQHHHCGGVATDGWGRTDVAGLLAVGEVAATGVHGANRLASNSLLEGLVFGARVADRLVCALPAPVEPDGAAPAPAAPADTGSVAAVRDVLSQHAGVVRDGMGLADAAARLAALRADVAEWLVAAALVAAATVRTESRGAHHRRDHPRTEPAWRRRVTVRLDGAGAPVASVDDEPLVVAAEVAA